MALQKPFQYRPSLDSQLCRDESWERVYYPPDTDSLRPPFSSVQGRESFYSSIRDKLHSRYCDLKDRYTARYSLCKERDDNQRCSMIYHGYFFRSKAVVLILLINALFSTATSGMGTALLQFTLGPEYTFTPFAITYGVNLILFPLLGHISDTYICRHKVIQFSILSSWICLSLLGASLSFSGYNEDFDLVTKYGTLPIAFVVLCVSFVCFMSNVIPFALDQLQGASHVHYSSFFYWWYWTFAIGVTIVQIPEHCSNNAELRLLSQVELSLVCVTIALVLDILFGHWCVIEPHLSNQRRPLIQTLRILCYAIRPHPNQRIPSAVHHELDLSTCNRLELAKKRYGGKFDTEEVENTRTFFNILSIIIPIGILLISYFGVSYCKPLASHSN